MSDLLLKNPKQFPDDTFLKDILEARYLIYFEIKKLVCKINSNIEFLWNYYKDGKAWLCKVVLNKTTIFWLSVWNDCIKVTFYFSGKKKLAFMESDINDVYKKKLSEAKASGKISPLTLELADIEDLKDFAAIVALKIKLK